MLSAEQVKADFKQRGQTIAGWAQEHGYKPISVYQVIGGFTKANYGISHEIAVKLGMKSANN